MKMGAGIFWGIMFIILGFGLIIKWAFNIDVPIFRILIAFLLIYLGLRIMFGGGGIFNFKGEKNDVIFRESRFSGIDKNNKEYNVIFGNAVFDLTDIELKEEPSTMIKINTIFAGTEVWISKDIPVRINVDAVFSGARIPGGNSSVFGSSLYESESYDKDKPHLYIKADVVFAGFEVKYK